MPLYQLPEEPVFPLPSEAEADGLLAFGGDLSPKRLVAAYQNGIFPWYDNDSPEIMWWSPDPRMVLFPPEFKVSKSLRQKIRRKVFEIKTDTAFEEVIAACAKTYRPDQDGTWITQEMYDAFVKMHKMGLAHSVECWQNDELVGGLYGLSFGKVFFGESMFHRVTDASKVAFYYLSQLAIKANFDFIDCQMHTSHLESLGAIEIPREDYLEMLAESVHQPTLKGRWEWER